MTGQSTSALSEARFRIAGFGSAYPSLTVTNHDLADQLGVDARWIESRCGIRSRRVAAPGETTTSLAVMAAENAVAPGSVLKKGISPPRHKEVTKPRKSRRSEYRL